MQQKLKITTREEYHKHIRDIRLALPKPYMKDFIMHYFGKELSRERYLRLHSRIKNYLNGVSYIGGLELGLNDKFPEYHHKKANHATKPNRQTEEVL